MSYEEIIKSWDYSHPYVTDPAHLYSLYLRAVQLTEKRGALRVLDIGTFHGHSASIFRLAGAEVVTVDIALMDYQKINKMCPGGFPIVFHIGDGKSFLRENEFDIIFHDAEHGQHMVPEFNRAWEVLKPGGFLAIHDADQFGVHEFIAALEGCVHSFVLVDMRDRLTAVMWKKEAE